MLLKESYKDDPVKTAETFWAVYSQAIYFLSSVHGHDAEFTFWTRPSTSRYITRYAEDALPISLPAALDYQLPFGTPVTELT